jgi:glycosyltransferase 2 family protein
VGLIALIFLLLVASLILWFCHFPHAGEGLLLALGMLSISAAVFFVSLYKISAGRLTSHGNKWVQRLGKVVNAYMVYRGKTKALAIFFTLSFFEHLMPVIANVYTAKALGIPINAAVFFVAIPIILIFARLPISFEGFGVQEGLYLLLFQMAGVTQDGAASIAVLIRVLTVIALVPGGVLFLLARDKVQSSFRPVSEDSPK